MEIVQVAAGPVAEVTLVEPVTKAELQIEAAASEAESNNQTEAKIITDSKTGEHAPDLQVQTVEKRPVEVLVAPASSSSSTDAANAQAGEVAAQQLAPPTEGSDHVVTPADTIEAASAFQTETQAVVNSTTTPETEVSNNAGHATATQAIEASEDTVALAEEAQQHETEHIETATDPSFLQADGSATLATSLDSPVNPVSPIEKKPKHDKKQTNRYVAPLVERIVQAFTQEATAKGEEVSVDVQSNICLIEQMFLTLGRRSPLQDMYTAEEEEMLDLLFHSNSSDNLPIDV
ncbi:hypothetical protein BBJ28_00011964 [Nothophytophthora sp. Chile5]|nr:hypothetical protein BBJ28_00011964 [Nothophytophthora sp. Chile5]